MRNVSRVGCERLHQIAQRARYIVMPPQTDTIKDLILTT